VGGVGHPTLFSVYPYSLSNYHNLGTSHATTGNSWKLSGERKKKNRRKGSKGYYWKVLSTICVEE
jgi:hypothetical protein